MTRIIGGSAGGRRLRTPPGEATRPTSDRVREALFSALEAELGTLHGLRFLDLYAGSGAVALEAASRGAVSVTAVESDRRTAAIVTANAAALGLPVDVRAQPVASVLASAAPTPFDVVFLDPPYALGSEEVAEVLAALVSRGWVEAGGAVVLERSARSVAPSWPDGLEVRRQKKYGETVLWYLRRVSD
ncbi:16S rRNA (guanine(966)-N(2))-methyltransferase RsmD [Nocardioides pocheonensis]|uniref:16S rRNA (Guanine(966)-N(2))-methyltransferase RsmD n=1 Tax=Nocardioides pocheonensis TaxID=661485 RepID=A0A3N0GTM9_9ACTN|nr:16S rRNA (guanine(966)-N(2))-methyltransferase RsmD [Nocardioides pocheonensis]RNM15807.1 16S rRNA (guanine(966)-N(2))-methyltransferase RsmD [Nocardioides pocheonensis]